MVQVAFVYFRLELGRNAPAIAMLRMFYMPCDALFGSRVFRHRMRLMPGRVDFHNTFFCDTNLYKPRGKAYDECQEGS